MAKANKHYYANTSIYNEAIRTLRTNISFSDVDKKLKSFVITSSVPDEGKTTISLEVAKSFATNGFKVLLMDCDLRNPSASKELGIDSNLGLVNILIKKIPLNEVKIGLEDYPNLHILPTGPIPPNPSEIITSEAMTSFLKSVYDTYDYIFIDTPPVGILTDAAIMASKADGVILVVKSNATSKDMVKHAVENIEKVGGNIIGSVLSFAPTKGTNYGSYYYTK